MTEAYLVVGLGNPGPKYGQTRHNIGFRCVEAWGARHGAVWKPESRMKAMVARMRVGGKTVLLAEPTTYMNCSGEAVRALGQYHKIAPAQTLVVLDDIDLPWGRMRFRPGGSAGSHNGMKSVLAQLGTSEIPRLRVGVGAPPPRWDLADYVLSPFTPAEEATVPTILGVCADAIDVWLESGTDVAMNRFNSQVIVPPVDETC